MKTLTCRYIDDTIKPKIILECHNDLVCLLDTGADTAVWTIGEKALKRIFPDAEKTVLKFIISGFGSRFNEENNRISVEIASVYRIPMLMIGTIDDFISVENLYIALSDSRLVGADLILPYTLFSKSGLLFNGLKNPKELSIITDDCGKIWAKYNSVNLDRNTVGGRQNYNVYKQLYGLTDREIINNQFIANGDVYVQDEVENYAVDENAKTQVETKSMKAF